MAKKTTERGKEYFENASKMIEWPTEIGVKADDYKGRILVPHYDMERANENLTVQHLLNLGYVIQSTIDAVGIKKVFDPEIKTVAPTRTKQEIEEFPIGSQYKVGSTGTILQLENVKTHNAKGKLSKPIFEFNYAYENRSQFTCYRENLIENLKRGSWVKLA